MKKPVKLKTHRLTICALTPEELTLFAADKGAFEDSYGLARSADETDEHLENAFREISVRCLEHPADYFWYTVWIMIKNDENRIVGCIGFHGEPNGNHEVEIGYNVYKSNQNNGYASEAVKKLCEWVFAYSNVYYIRAVTEGTNAASIKVLERNGFKADGYGSEGLQYEKEKPKTSWLAIYMCIGLSVGLSIGTSLGNTSIGMTIGMSIGLAVGAALDTADAKYRKRKSEQIK